jgi:hypothetical protein
MELKWKTTTECIDEAEAILKEAEQVETREQHAKVWDRKADLLNFINDRFETGAFTGEAYNELWTAKHILFRAESVAGKRSLETYAKNL